MTESLRRRSEDISVNSFIRIFDQKNKMTKHFYTSIVIHDDPKCMCQFLITDIRLYIFSYIRWKKWFSLVIHIERNTHRGFSNFPETCAAVYHTPRLRRPAAGDRKPVCAHMVWLTCNLGIFLVVKECASLSRSSFRMIIIWGIIEDNKILELCR